MIDTDKIVELSEVFSLGYKKAMIDCRRLNPKISQRQATKIFKGKLTRWIDKGLIKPEPTGGKILYDYLTLCQLDLCDK